MKKLNRISSLLVMLCLALFLFSSCGTGNTQEINLSVSASDKVPADLNAIAAILSERAELFTGTDVTAGINKSHSTITLKMSVEDSLVVPGKLFSTAGMLKFSPLISYREVMENPVLGQQISSWIADGLFDPAEKKRSQDAFTLSVPEGSTHLTELIAVFNATYGQFRLIPEEEAVNGRITLYIADNSQDQLTGKQVKSASCDGNTVLLEFDKTGSEHFAVMTKLNIGKRIAIIVDNKVVSAPLVRSEINGGKAAISGNYTPGESCLLAAILGGGALPDGIIVK